MAKRKTTYRVQGTEQVQGEDSFVEILYSTWGEFVETIKNAGKKMSPKQQMAEREADLKKRIVSWNWVDEEGKPLGSIEEALPKLLSSEHAFLTDAMYYPPKVDPKN